ncbi:hypothetical protein [Methylobacterium sp. ID0610]|uniref:hypothetical protein n=1 Tax=Methylobacterium carpenticola TaxID=3344827 RepID=UPI0036B3D15A
MSDDDTLARALADVSERRAALQAEYDRIAAELAKLNQAENALRAIVENAPLPDAILDLGGAERALRLEARAPSRRGARGPRANSAKGRLRTLLDEAGPQGLSHAQIVQRLPDVAPATLNAYLSTMVTNDEAVRNGDFYRSRRPEPSEETDEADGIASGEDSAPENDGRAAE